MPFEGKLSTDKFYPVTLYTSAMIAVNSVNYNGIIVKYFESTDLTFTKYTPSNADWVIIGNGKYKLNIGASEFTKIGTYEVTVTGTNFIDYNYIVDVRPMTISELMNRVATSATLNTVSTNVTTISGYTAGTKNNVTLIKTTTDKLPGGGTLNPLATSATLNTVSTNVTTTSGNTVFIKNRMTKNLNQLATSATLNTVSTNVTTISGYTAGTKNNVVLIKTTTDKFTFSGNNVNSYVADNHNFNDITVGEILAGTVDNTTLEIAIEKILSYCRGKVLVNGNLLTYYYGDNVTSAISLSSTNYHRTRISG